MGILPIFVSRKSMASIVTAESIVHEDIGASEPSNGPWLSAGYCGIQDMTLEPAKEVTERDCGEVCEVCDVGRARGNIQPCQGRGGRLPPSPGEIILPCPGQAQAATDHKTYRVSGKYGTRDEG